MQETRYSGAMGQLGKIHGCKSETRGRGRSVWMEIEGSECAMIFMRSFY